jgi:hypothetical protein
MSGAMKTMLILSLVALLSGMVATGGVASDPRREPEQALKITVFPRQGWILDFYPDGRVHAQWGSLPGDGASLPEGTVGFEALLAAIRRLRVDAKIENGTQVAVLEASAPSATAFYVSDDTLFRYLVMSFGDRWRQDAGGTRFHELLEANPIYPADANSKA